MEKLKALEEKKKQIEAKIKTLKAKENAQKKKVDTRRKILVGAMVLNQVEMGEWPESRLKEAMDRFLTRDKDRTLFGLHPKEIKPEQHQEKIEPQLV